MSAPAPTSWQPPRLPEPLQGRSAVVIAPDAAGNWFAWSYIWGEFAGGEPLFVGADRAAVSRNLQDLSFEALTWIAPA